MNIPRRMGALYRRLFPPDTDPRCKAMSGSLVGYRCRLPKDHPLPHRARISTSTDVWGEVVGTKEAVWPTMGHGPVGQ